MEGVSIEQALFIVVNLVIIESLLCVDNAIIISGVFTNADKKSRTKIILSVLGIHVAGQFVALLFASWLANIWWLPLFSGIGLIYFGQALFRKKDLKFSTRSLVLWSTFLGITINPDTGIHAVAFTGGKPGLMPLVYFGVFIGIIVLVLLVRLYFWLLDRFPSIFYVAAFFMVGKGLLNLGAIPLHYYEGSAIQKFVDSEGFDLVISLLVIGSTVVCIGIEMFRKRKVRSRL